MRLALPSHHMMVCSLYGWHAYSRPPWAQGVEESRHSPPANTHLSILRRGSPQWLQAHQVERLPLPALRPISEAACLTTRCIACTANRQTLHPALAPTIPSRFQSHTSPCAARAQGLDSLATASSINTGTQGHQQVHRAPFVPHHSGGQCCP